MFLARHLARPFVSHVPHTDELVFYQRLSIKVHRYPRNLEQALYEHRLGRPTQPIIFLIRDESSARKTPIIAIEWHARVGFVVKWLVTGSVPSLSLRSLPGLASAANSRAGSQRGSIRSFSSGKALILYIIVLHIFIMYNFSFKIQIGSEFRFRLDIVLNF